MKVLSKRGREDIAVLYTALTDDGRVIEFVESLQPPIPREKKWVLIISTLKGCPVHCRMCDAGEMGYGGPLSSDEILSQIDFLVKKRYPDGVVPVEKFKIQFARMGEPTFNDNVLEVLEVLPSKYSSPGLMPCLSTIAPEGRDEFFERLKVIKKRLYPLNFQLQFSIHSTDESIRDYLMPVKKWNFEKIARYGESFHNREGRKVTLNFALADGIPFDPHVLAENFSPEVFLIKITPVNPTFNAQRNNLFSKDIVQKWGKYNETLETLGYDVILSAGEPEENLIGSNCGQYAALCEKIRVAGAYTYGPEELRE